MVNIVAFTGPKGAGKDTASESLIDNGYVLLKFADPLKDMLRTFLQHWGETGENIERMIEGDLKEVPHEAFGGRTTRHAMQTLGTEWGRMLISPYIWTNVFKRRANREERVVVTDMRFLNETAAVKEVDDCAVLVRIVRSERDGPTDDMHPSEVEQWSLPVHHVVHNLGTIEELKQQIQDLPV